MQFYLFIRWLQDIVMILNLILFTFLYMHGKLDRAAKIIFVYVIVGAAFALLSIFRYYLNSVLFSWIHHYSVVIHFSLFSLFISRVKIPLLRSAYFDTFCITWSAILLFSVIISNHEKWMFSNAFCNFGVFLIGMKYYSMLFSNIVFLDIKKDFAFWIITGFFMCASVTLPIIAFHYFLGNKLITDFITVKNLSAIGAIAFVILHLFVFWAAKTKVNDQKLI